MRLIEWSVIDETDRKHINEVIDSNCFVKEPYVKKLAEKFSEYIGVPFCSNSKFVHSRYSSCIEKYSNFKIPKPLIYN